MQLLVKKLLLTFCIFAGLLNLNTFADLERAEVEVNFYMLAANQPMFNNTRIAIRGWIGFYEYDSGIKILVFPSSESLTSFNKNEAIMVLLDPTERENAKAYLDRKFVTVYGLYKQSSTSGLFGHLEEISDIDIIATP